MASDDHIPIPRAWCDAVSKILRSGDPQLIDTTGQSDLMKRIRMTGQTSSPGWTATVTNHRVLIPNVEGTGFSQTIEVEIEAWKNQAGELIIPGNVKAELEDLKARYMGLLAPEQIRELRQRLGLTQKNISALLQLGEKTWTRWETGRERPSRSMNILLHSLWDGRIDADYLKLLRRSQQCLQSVDRTGKKGSGAATKRISTRS